jgi:hypothetical protein
MLSTKQSAVAVHVIKHVFAAGTSNCLRRAITCNPFGAFIPVSNDAFTVNKVNPIKQIVY